MMALIAFRFDSPARDSPGNAVAAAQPCQPAPSQGIPMPRWAEGTGSCLEWPGLSSQHGPNNAVLLPWALFVVLNAAGAALLQDGTAVKPPTTCHHKDPMQPHPSSGCSSALPREMLGHLMKPSAMGQSRSGNMGVTDECRMAMLHVTHVTGLGAAPELGGAQGWHSHIPGEPKPESDCPQHQALVLHCAAMREPGVLSTHRSSSSSSALSSSPLLPRSELPPMSHRGHISAGSCRFPPAGQRLCLGQQTGSLSTKMAPGAHAVPAPTAPRVPVIPHQPYRGSHQSHGPAPTPQHCLHLI